MTPTEERELLRSVIEEYELDEDDIGVEELNLLWLAKMAELGREIPVRDAASLISFGRWNTLHHSGDCFDLAAHLRLDIEHFEDCSVPELYVEVYDRLGTFISARERFDDESERPAATRLAVTRAAAEIGRRMKG